ncbi:MAG TPA: hypothetical protein VES02_11050 [Dermatophilaceae bacterium]|nr:hypothetical protein [Dermatophilaceae bacterium]
MRQQQISRRPRARDIDDALVAVPTEPLVVPADAADLVVRIDALLATVTSH